MKRGVIYIYWGDKVQKELDRSVNSISKIHPDLDIHLHKLEEKDKPSLLSKSKMAEITPFDNTLFLDTDTIVLDNLDYGFEASEKHGLACCICECPWARRFPTIQGDVIEYNTGVIFFTEQSRKVFDEWHMHSGSQPSSIVMYNHFNKDVTTKMPSNDQAGFAFGVKNSNFNPHILPMNWNLRPMWQKALFGPVKIWHDRSEVPELLHAWNEHQTSQYSIIDFNDNIYEVSGKDKTQPLVGSNQWHTHSNPDKMPPSVISMVHKIRSVKKRLKSWFRK